MTAPNFFYPQPTDHELAAQQTAPPQNAQASVAGTSGPGAAGAVAEAGGREAAGAVRPGLGRAALILAIAAAGLSLFASAILGTTVGPIEVEHGSYFSGAPSWYAGLGVGLFGLQALCTIAGLAGLVMGIVATAAHRGRTHGIVAIVIAALAPLISFALFLTLSYAFV